MTVATRTSYDVNSRPDYFFLPFLAFLAAFFAALGAAFLALDLAGLAAFFLPNTFSQFFENVGVGPVRTIGPDIVVGSR